MSLSIYVRQSDGGKSMRKEIWSLLGVAMLVSTGVATSENKPVMVEENVENLSPDEMVKQRVQISREKLSRSAHEDQTVLKIYDLFAAEVMQAFIKGKSLSQQEVDQIFDALDFAAEKHKLQTRKNKAKTPYISHPIGVAYNVMHYGEVKDADIIMGALLHDTVQDTETTLDELTKIFNSQVSSYVRELTMDKSLAQVEKKRAEVIKAADRSIGAAQIELADKLYNVTDLLNNPPDGWTQSRIDGYYQWVQSVIDRLPPANEKLKGATEIVINEYWTKTGDKKSKK